MVIGNAASKEKVFFGCGIYFLSNFTADGEENDAALRIIREEDKFKEGLR